MGHVGNPFGAVGNLFAALAGALLWIGCKDEAPRLNPSPLENGAIPTLDCIAPMIITNCATSNCHDAEARVHGMDFSTPSGIYEGLTEHGLDICQNRIRDRVRAGDPDASFVINKVEGNLDCDQSLPMPPSPAPPLSSEQIERLRAWIAVGAPPHCTEETLDLVSAGGSPGSADGHANHDTSSSGGTSASSTTSASATTTSLGGTTSTTSGGETTGTGAGAPTETTATTSTTGTTGSTSDDQVGIVCTTEIPCPGDGYNYTCTGAFCGDTWECFGHKPAASSLHPCSEDIIPFCACDGTTFEAPIDCPNRPYTHAGACDEGFNCDPWKLNCEDEPPTCPDGELPSVVDDCWGDCVPATSCKCQYHWHCGDDPDYECVSETLSCEPRPPAEE
jgi:hypothetical protein